MGDSKSPINLRMTRCHVIIVDMIALSIRTEVFPHFKSYSLISLYHLEILSLVIVKAEIAICNCIVLMNVKSINFFAF